MKLEFRFLVKLFCVIRTIVRRTKYYSIELKHEM